MNWLQARIELGTLDSDAVEDALLAMGAVAIEYRDAGDQPILEPPAGATPLWQQLRLIALFDAATDPDLVRLAVAAAVRPAQLPAITFDTLAERDWIADFQRSLEPLQFGPRLWVCPTGTECPDPQATSIRLDPGLAFGTGSHATTALCLEWLAEQPPPARLLDFGCGSGILAIAGLALGANEAWALDNDPQALLATAANASVNALDDRLRTTGPAALPSAKRFDIVVANILSGTLIELAALLTGHCRAGGRIALSGILDTQADAVRNAYTQIRWDEPRVRDHWVLLTGTARN